MCYSHYLFPLQLNGQGTYFRNLKRKKKLPENGFQIKKCGFVSAALRVCKCSARTLNEAINQLYVCKYSIKRRVFVSALCNETLMSLSVIAHQKARLQRPQQGGRGRCHTQSTAGDAAQGPQEAQQLADTNCA